MNIHLLRRALGLYLCLELTRVSASAASPTVLSLTPTPNSTVSNLTQVTVVFNVPVRGVEAGDLLINGGPADSVSSTNSTNFVFTFTQPPPGAVAFYFDTDEGITDFSGNYFDPASAGSWLYTLLDNIPPTVLSTLPSPGATIGSFSQVQIMFSEAVTNVDATDLLINGASLTTNLTGNGEGPYLFQFPPQPGGSNSLAWADGHGIQDLAPTPNAFAGGSWSYTVDPSAAAGNVVINEFLASAVATNGLVDEDGQLSDWIELYNRGTNTVNLNGWSLTSDPSVPTMWTFPSVTIGAGQYLVLWASGKDRKVTVGTNKLHTNFELGTPGQYLGLFNSDYVPQAVNEFAPSYPDQRNDISYGYDPTNALKYFFTPTPGGPNGNSAVSGLVEPVHFSINSGFFNSPFYLYLTTPTPGATIRYTTDFTEPTLANGTNYTVPLLINTQTTIIRAAAFQTNVLPSLVETRRFFYVEDIVHQPVNPPGYPSGTNVWGVSTGNGVTNTRSYYPMDPVVVTNALYSNTVRSCLLELPTISIVSGIDGLFGPVNGIYTHTTDATPTSFRGPGWERACSAEFILPDGTSGFLIDCGVQIQGGSSRNPTKNPKHSFRLNFKSAYSFGQIHYQMFPDSPVDQFNTFVLDLGINYWWHYIGTSSPTDQRQRAQCVRDQFIADIQNATGSPCFHGRFAHVYINNLYWGICYIHERPDEDFAASYFGGDKSQYDVAKNTTFGYQQLVGDKTAYNTLMSLCAVGSGLTNNAAYEAVQQYCDVDNLIDHMIVNIWGGNTDWPQHNWYVIRKRQPGAGFKFITWDAEHTLKSASQDFTGVNFSEGPGYAYSNLQYNAEFRLRFADHLQKHLFNDGVLYSDPNPTNALWNPAHPERNRPATAYMKRINEITNALVAESARWGGYGITSYATNAGVVTTLITPTNYTRNNQWLKELNALLGVTNDTSYSSYTYNWFPTRRSNVVQQFRNRGLFPIVAAPSFSQFGGRVVAPYSLYMTNNATNSGTIYYTTNGTDPRLYGSGTPAPGAQVFTNGVPVILNSSTDVKARLLSTNGVSAGIWSALVDANFTVGSLGLPLRITELMYNPIGGDAYEFLELQNIGSAPINIGSFSFSGITFTFPAGTLFGPGTRLVLASNNDTNAWKGRYPGVNVAGWYGGKLANSGERIALLDSAGNTITSVTYTNAAGGWPAAADGIGYSLEITDPNGDPNDPANWHASNIPNGSPGLANSAPAAPTILLNEVMADNLTAVANGGTYPDWVELYNPGGSDVDLANWSLSNSGDPRKYVLPSTNIAAGGYLVIWCDTNTAAPGLHTGFSLARTGENLFLYNPNVSRVDAISFGLQLTDYSLGRVGGAWQLTTPTPNAPNAAAVLGAATNLVVNEWLASSPNGSDWLELFNRSGTAPVSLHNIYLGTSNDLFQIRSFSFLPPLGYLQLFADQLPGPNHLDFKLHGAGDAIILSDETGGEMSRVTFGLQLDNISQGRLPDGSANIITFPGTASPGTSNYVAASTGPILNEFLAKNITAVTNSAGRVADYLELYNPNPTNFPLAGMSLSVDQIQPGQWVFPAGAVINAQSYLVIWADGGLPASTTLEANLNIGRPIDGHSGGLYLFSATGQLMDSVEYGFQIPDLSLGRSGGAWKLLTSPTPGATNAAPSTLGLAANLRINEWMASPLSGDDWFEVYNLDVLPVALAGLFLTDDPSVEGQTNFVVAPLSFIGGNGFVKWWADGLVSKGHDHISFKLDGLGETIRLYNTNVSLIDAVEFGFQIDGVSQGRLPDGAATIVSFFTSPSPEESNYLPLPSVVINEVLTHPEAPFEDAIELLNVTGSPLPVGGWYLSNTKANLKKYRLPDGTSVPAAGFLVLYENQFNSNNPATPFTLNSAHGDEVWLSAADGAGVLTGYRASASLGAAETNVSFGRFDTSVGTDFPAMSARTFGADSPATVEAFRAGAGQTNSYPKVGPIVINEIMYHPPDVGITDDTLDEYIELYNLSGNDVPMYDPAYPTNRWQLRDGVSFTFSNQTVITAGGYVLVVSFDPVANPAQLTAFRTRYGVSAAVPVYGPYAGKLANDGEAIELVKPDGPRTAPPADAGFVPYVRVDRVAYTDHTPWPSGADGNPNGVGLSLQRRVAANYGNEPLNWVAAAPTPGAGNGVAFLTVPIITQQPTDAGGVPGTTASFSVAASGSGPLTYQWRLNGVNVAALTNATILLANIQPGISGNYTVFISNPAGSVLSSAATLIAAPVPTILQQPQSQVSSPGGTATFSVLTTGTQLTYQWRFNGTNLPGATNASLTLTNLQNANIGPYSVVIFDYFTPAVSANAFLVISAPAFTLHPQGATNYIGSTATFNVAASGDAPLVFQWRKNGTNIANATNTSLVLPNLQLTNSGNFDAVVSNPAASATSAVAVLKVILPLVITQQPTNAVVNPGTNVNFSVNASGQGPLTYQWLFNGLSIADNVSATTSNLTLANVQLTNNGLYSAVIRDDYSTTNTTNASLIVKVRPIITQQPVGVTVAAGGTANISVTASGTLPMGFRWRKGIATMANANFTNVPFNTSVLSITNVQASDATNYAVAVTNIVGAPLTGLSSNAYLTVVFPPTNQIASSGSNATFNVSAAGHVPLSIFYQWQFNGVDIAGETNNSLNLLNVQPTNAGTYGVVVTVTNTPAAALAIAPATFTAGLTVLVPPQITIQPVDQIVNPGSTAAFSVTATGIGPTYQWYFNNGSLGGSATDPTLTLTNAQPANAGPYFVVVANNVGSVTSAVVNLTLREAPGITVPPASQTVNAGDGVAFNVTATGTAPLSYQWRFNDTDLSGQTGPTLSLSNVQSTNEGSYSVMVTNLAGNILSPPAFLSVLIPPILSQPKILPGGNFQMRLQGNTNRNYDIEISSNLTNWANLATVTYTNGLMPFVDTNAPDTNKRFYRARLAQ